MATYNANCRRKSVTTLADITPGDFVTTATAVRSSGGGAGPNDWDVTVNIKPGPTNSDVATITQSGTATLYDDITATSGVETDAGPNTGGAPAQLNLAFPTVLQTVPNTGNVWKVSLVNLVVVGKGGQTLTVPSITLTFKSPL